MSLEIESFVSSPFPEKYLFCFIRLVSCWRSGSAAFTHSVSNIPWRILSGDLHGLTPGVCGSLFPYWFLLKPFNV